MATNTLAMNQHQQQIIHSITGQTLVVPCRNYTLASIADVSRRPSGGGATARAKSPLAGAAPFQLTVPQISGIALIIWHKDHQMNSPIFAADVRGVSSIRDARQQVSADALRGRARMELVEAQTNRVLAPGPTGGAIQALPALVIEDAGTQDAGLYTCTVEFHKAPTQTYQTRVAVADPPKNMVIRDETNGPLTESRQLYSSLAGPFDEDSRLLLVCRADPGRPTIGQISWWQLDSVTPLGADLIRSAASARARGSTNQASALQPLDNKAKYLLTLSLGDSADETSAVMAATPNSQMGSPEGDIGTSDMSREVAGVSGSSLMQSGDLFLGASSIELDAQQLVALGQLPRALLVPSAADQRQQRHLRHWRRVDNRTVIPSSSEEGGGGKQLEAHLELTQLTRANLGDEYLCLASNGAQFAAPLNASVRLNMNLKPLSVHIHSKTNGSFTLGQKAMVECHALGSKPSAIIKWFKGGRELETTASLGAHAAASSKTLPTIDHVNANVNHENLISEFNRDISNLTKISYLTFVPQPGDNQQQLSCSAQNPRMPQTPTLSDALTMNVQSAPRLALKFGTNIRPDAIHLNGDIFMDCNMEANPPVSELLWLHDGEPLAPNISAGVIMSNQSLVLRQIRIEQRGVYQCLARNALGRALSNKLELRPKFAPICDQTLTRTRYELALNQRARIECHVLAEPSEDLHFTWRFNNSASGATSPSDAADSNVGADVSSSALMSDRDEQLRHYETNFTRSSLSFTPRSRRDFGQLLCGATNSMGRQEKPCAIQLVQSELPEPLLGCFIDNQTHNSFSIHCQPRAVGASSSSSRGGPIYFILELFANETLVQRQDDGMTGSSSSTVQQQQQDRRQRQQLNLRPANEAESRNQLQAPEESMQDEDYSASSARGSRDDDHDHDHADDANDEMALERRRVRRLLSDAPSFNVIDLKPNSSYNVLVYVQNSKGRSPATHHQVSTRPMDGAAPLASSGSAGRVELLSKRDELGAGGLGAKLLSFLALGAHFRDNSADGSAGWLSSRRPLTSVALIVLLATLSLLALVGLASRLVCRRGGKQTRRVAPRTCRTGSLQDHDDEDDNEDSGSGKDGEKRKSSSSASEMRGFVRPEPRERIIDGPNAGSVNGSARPLISSTSSNSTTMSRAAATKQLGRQQQMQLACNTLNVHQNGCTGSGSETSRETNTDSTFVSSPQTGTESSCQSVEAQRLMRQQQQQQMCNNYNSMQHPRRCSKNSMQAPIYSSGSLQKAPSHFQAVPSAAYSMVNKRPLSQAPPKSRPIAARHFDHTEHSCTPQISLHSGSECWSNNSPDAQAMQQQQPPPLGALMHDGIYVLDAGHHHQTNHSPGCLAAAGESEMPGFWLASDNQHTTQDNLMNRCHLIESETSELPLNVQPCGMPNSFSIPISLSDRLQMIGGGGGSGDVRPISMNTRRLSQDNLTSAMLLDSNGQSFAAQPQTGSYLTLAPSFTNQHSPLPLGGSFCETPLSIIDQQQQQQQLQQLELTPPIDFANDFRRFKQTFGINESQHQDNERQKHRVKFETANEEQHNSAAGQEM